MKLILDSTTIGEVSATMVMGGQTRFSGFGDVQLMRGCDMASPVLRGGDGVTIATQVTFKTPQTLAAGETQFIDLLDDGRLSGVLTIQASDDSTLTFDSAVVTPSRISQRGARVDCFWDITAGSKGPLLLEDLPGATITAGKLLEDGTSKLMEDGGTKLLEDNI